ncbi:lysophospholipid acyltransferase family protein [Paremcibacter congregatus]|uniref:Phospholipid/glycerol acyltransferase domain-containing protein n=1 Tax=Paremcibacter congregatus TaxID=2043170 RepID=A0A2G4YP98_9PROT|nr:lysophospholipid acyltransferase family protein [Paremcibacter congregatus]PHZ84125.1 hypothetical protein CRD36_13075 [Paremcibacter congregatus]QDE25814.1 1-acyl-sn-glycerol-3-phosphate acyltransferase [Paremcibacter congregatus]
MNYLRSFLFNAFFWILAPLWILLVLTPLSFFKSPAPMRKAIMIWFHIVFFMLDKISGIKVEERGIENLPKDQGFILCCKHMSNLEALIAYRRMPNLTALAKIELFRIPGVRHVLNKMGVVPIDRGKGTAQVKTPEIAATLQEKKIPLLLFVEGTRIPVGERRRLKTGVYYLQKDTNLPVICASTNTGVHWLKGSPFNKPGTIVMQYHPALEFDLPKAEFMEEVRQKVVLHSEELMGVEGKEV